MIDSNGLRFDLRALFPVSRHFTYLDHAAVGPTSTAVRDAMVEAANRQTAEGVVGFDYLQRGSGHVRESLARLVNGTPDKVAFVQNTSMGLSIAAHGVTWTQGQNVVLPRDEFPSNFYPWTNLRRLGVDVRLTSRSAQGSALEGIRAAVDKNTTIVAVSAVQFSDGFRQDLAAIADVCAQHGALFVVDGTQAVGGIVVDVAADSIDVLAVGAHKWMLGPAGTGFVHFSERAMQDLVVDTAGWMSVSDPFAMDRLGQWDRTARRFEAGTENLLGTRGIGAAADLFLGVGPDIVEGAIMSLVRQAIDEADAAGLEVVSSRSAAHRSGILIVKNPAEDPVASHQRLIDAAVRCSVRGGGIRLSPHFYNTEAEISFAISTLAENAQ